jgi:hypothetical protein
VAAEVAASYRPKSLAATKVPALTPVLRGFEICNRRNGGNMASEQMQQLAALFESGRERFSNNNLGLQDVRDICEGLHAASAEPEPTGWERWADAEAVGVTIRRARAAYHSMTPFPPNKAPASYLSRHTRVSKLSRSDG